MNKDPEPEDSIPLPLPFNGNPPGPATMEPVNVPAMERQNVQETPTLEATVSIPVFIPLPLNRTPPGPATTEHTNVPESSTPSLIRTPPKKRTPANEKPDDSACQELQHPRKPVSLRESPQRGVSKEMSGKATTEEYMQLNMPEMTESVLPFLNKGDALIVEDTSDRSQQIESSDCSQRKSSEQLFMSFQKEYVPLIDDQMQNLMKITFKSVDHAVVSLNTIIRSYLSGFSVHRKGSYKRANEDSKLFVLECHTQSHKKAVSSCRCPWKAVIRYDDSGAKFDKIDTFILHSLYCFCRNSQLTPDEVKLRYNIPSNQLNGVMKTLKQQKIGKKAIYMRNYRARLAARAMVNKE